MKDREFIEQEIKALVQWEKDCKEQAEYAIEAMDDAHEQWKALERLLESGDKSGLRLMVASLEKARLQQEQDPEDLIYHLPELSPKPNRGLN